MRWTINDDSEVKDNVFCDDQMAEKTKIIEWRILKLVTDTTTKEG